MACSFPLKFAFVEISIVFYFGEDRDLTAKILSLSPYSSVCCPYDQELWVTTNRMRRQPSHRNKMFTLQVSWNCTFNLYMLYVSHSHFYKLCHITRRLQVYELIFMSECEGGCWWCDSWTWHLTPTDRCLRQHSFFYKKFVFFGLFMALLNRQLGRWQGMGWGRRGMTKPLWMRHMLYQLSYCGAPETVF